MKEVIAIYAGKGGVGKTTFTYNLACMLAMRGDRVLVIDFDSQCDLTEALYEYEVDIDNCAHTMFKHQKYNLENAIQPTTVGGETMENLFIVPGSPSIEIDGANNIRKSRREFTLKSAIKTVEDKFDYVIIDCPPTRTEIPVNAAFAATRVITPVVIDDKTIDALNRTLQLMGEVHETDDIDELIEDNKLKFFINIYDAQSASVNKEVVPHLESIKSATYDTMLRKRVDYKKAGLRSKPLVMEFKRGGAVDDIKNLFEQIGL